MANFLETQPIEFTKLAPAPIELYGQIGMMKQAMYDANTAKIQGYYDSIAGMDLAKDSQKAYLNEKLQQLQTDLGALSEADFSKQSIVNQAAGMAGPISKDPLLLQAVMSTAQFRKEVAAQEKAQKTGKSHYTNDDKFNTEAQEWLTDGKVDTPFTANYFEYRDVKKKIFLAMKEKGMDVNENDIFLNPDGVTYSDVMIREKNKGMSPQDIKNIIGVVLDGDDYKQLSIDGEYAYKNASPADLKKSIVELTEPDIALLKARQKEMKLDMSGAKGDAYIKIKQAYDDIDEQIASMVASNQRLFKQIDEGDVKGAGAVYHTTSYIDRFANTFAHTEYTREVLANPGKAEEWNKLNYALRLREVAAKEKEAGGGDILGTLSMGVPNIDLTTEKIKEALETEGTAIIEQKKDVIRNYSGTTNPEDGARWYTHQQSLYDERAFDKLDPVMKEHFDEIAIQERNYNNHKRNTDKIFSEVAELYPIDIQMPDELKNIPITDKEGNTQYYTSDEILAADRKMRLGEKHTGFFDRLTHAASDAVSLTGLPAVLAQSYLPEYFPDWMSLKDKKTFAKLTDREKFLVENGGLNDHSWERMVMPTGEGGLRDPQDWLGIRGSNQTGPTNQRGVDHVLAHGSAAYDAVYDKREGEALRRLKDRTGLGTVGMQPLATDPKQQPQMRAIMTDYAAELRRNNMGLGTGPLTNGATLDDLDQILAGDKSSFSLVTAPGNGYMDDQYAITVSGTVDGIMKTAYTTVSAQQIQGLLGKTKDPTAAESFAMDVQRTIIGTGNKTTNHLGSSADPGQAAQSSYLKAPHFNQVQAFSVRGDIVQGSSKNSVNVKLYIFNPRNKQWVPHYLETRKMLDYGSVTFALSQVNDAMIFKLLYPEETPTQAALQLIKKQSNTR